MNAEDFRLSITMFRSVFLHKDYYTFTLEEYIVSYNIRANKISTITKEKTISHYFLHVIVMNPFIHYVILLYLNVSTLQGKKVNIEIFEIMVTSKSFMYLKHDTHTF